MEGGTPEAGRLAWEVEQFLRHNLAKYHLTVPAADARTGLLRVIMIDREDGQPRHANETLDILREGGFNGQVIRVERIRPLFFRVRKM